MYNRYVYCIRKRCVYIYTYIHTHIYIYIYIYIYLCMYLKREIERKSAKDGESKNLRLLPVYIFAVHVDELLSIEYPKELNTACTCKCAAYTLNLMCTYATKLYHSYVAWSLCWSVLTRLHKKFAGSSWRPTSQVRREVRMHTGVRC